MEHYWLALANQLFQKVEYAQASDFDKLTDADKAYWVRVAKSAAELLRAC